MTRRELEEPLCNANMRDSPSLRRMADWIGYDTTSSEVHKTTAAYGPPKAVWWICNMIHAVCACTSGAPQSAGILDGRNGDLVLRLAAKARCIESWLATLKLTAASDRPRSSDVGDGGSPGLGGVRITPMPHTHHPSLCAVARPLDISNGSYD
eukprot:6197822-Amphidinium_carterae.1